MTKQAPAKANIQIWTKGFRVTEDTEEFQRCIPKGQDALSPLEAQLRAVRWGSLLEPLYKASDRDLSGQFCVLFEANEMMSISIGATTDKHGRPSLVLVSATSALSWEAQEPETLLPALIAVSHRLSTAYGVSFRGNPPQLQKQLKEDTFLQSRVFDLLDENQDTRQDWKRIVEAVRQWKGVKGIATPRLASIGANLIVGTRHESEQAMKLNAVDGYLDIRSCEIHPLTGAIAPWQPLPVTAPETGMAVEQPNQHSDLQELKASVARIEGRIEILTTLTERILAQLGRVQIKRRK